MAYRSRAQGIAGMIGMVGLLVLIVGSLALPFVPIARAAITDVSISNFAFVQSSVTISPGDSVRWTNNDGVTHTVTSNTGAWTPLTLAAGESGTIPFANAGTYAYHCSIHPSMTGTVVVTATGVPEFSSGLFVVVGLLTMMVALMFVRRRRA